MLRVAAILAGLALTFASLCGWGRAVTRLVGRNRLPWGLEAAVGVAAWVFLGGLLNLARMARPPAFDAVVAIGIILLVIDGLRNLRSGWRPRWPGWRGAVALGLPWLLVGGVATFVAITLVPPRAYNFHDDYLFYLVHPVRMLQTGTVFGSPVDGIGRQNLGGQAFLQGFALAHLPIRYVNAADLLGCGVLALSVLASWAAWRRLPLLPTLLALILATAVNPQYVNTTALYSGVVLVLAAILLPVSGLPPPGKPRSPLSEAALPALVATALVALKPTFLPVAVATATASVVAIAWSRQSLRAGLIHGLALLGMGTGFLLPWVLVHAPHYLASRAQPGVERPPLVDLAGGVNPIATAPLFYGNTVLHYTAVLALAGAVGIALLMPSRREASEARNGATGAALQLLGASLAFMGILVILGGTFGGADHTVRYVAPLAAAAGPAAVLLAFGADPGPRTSPGARAISGLASVGAALCIASFAPELGARGAQALHAGSVLAFRGTATRDGYLAYSHRILGGEEEGRVRRAQAFVPAGETLFAWIAAPIHLDFRRNVIIEADLGGLANPWALLPPTRFLLWSYRGPAIRTLAACQAMAQTEGRPWIDREGGRACVAWKRWLASLGGTADILYDDGEMVLMRTKEPQVFR
jgi:hypothetical protein